MIKQTRQLYATKHSKRSTPSIRVSSLLSEIFLSRSIENLSNVSTRSIFIKSIISCTKRYDEKLPFNAPFFFYIRNRKPFLCKKLGTVTFDYWAKRVIKESAIKECKKREGKGRQGDKRKERRDIRLKKKKKKTGSSLRLL